MPFTPRFSEAGEIEIVDSLLAVIDRDIQLALDYFYPPAGTLPKFAAMFIGAPDEFRFPYLVGGPERMSSAESEDGYYVIQDFHVGLGFVVKDTRVDLAFRKAMKYTRALKAVIRSATSGDLLPAVGQHLASGSYPVIDIDHRYFRHGEVGTEFTQAVELKLKLNFGEK